MLRGIGDLIFFGVCFSVFCSKLDTGDLAICIFDIFPTCFGLNLNVLSRSKHVRNLCTVYRHAVAQDCTGDVTVIFIERDGPLDLTIFVACRLLEGILIVDFYSFICIFLDFNAVIILRRRRYFIFQSIILIAQLLYIIGISNLILCIGTPQTILRNFCFHLRECTADLAICSALQRIAGCSRPV